MLNYISAHLHIYIHNCTSTSLHIFTSSHRHLCSSSSLYIYISAHVHICTSTSLLIFTSSHLHLTSLPLIYISHLHLSLFLTFSLKAGGSAAGPPRNATLCGDRARRTRETAQPSAEIVRVGCAKYRRECDLPRSGATLCGDRARRMRKTQARLQFGFVRRNPLRRSYASKAPNAGESAICPGPAQPSAEIAPF